MDAVLIAAGVVLGAGALCLLTAYICFYLAFYVPKRELPGQEEYPIPPGKIYEPFREVMVGWMKQTRAMPHEDFWIRSFDGLALHGEYYEYAPGAPIELMMHGYRGSAERDLCGGVQRAFTLGRSVLIVDQRASGRSEGKVITFGINERRDCLSWVDFMVEHFGPDVKIILTGISMGASTVLMAAGEELPSNVVGVLADCGFTTARDIIMKVIRQMKLPSRLLYPFVKLGAKIFGHFDLEETTALAAMEKCRLPVIFFHGESDNFVPCEMSRINFNACKATKRLVTVPGAGHGLSFPVDQQGYLDALADFSTQYGLPRPETRQ